MDFFLIQSCLVLSQVSGSPSLLVLAIQVVSKMRSFLWHGSEVEPVICSATPQSLFHTYSCTSYRQGKLWLGWCPYSTFMYNVCAESEVLCFKHFSYRIVCKLFLWVTYCFFLASVLNCQIFLSFQLCLHVRIVLKRWKFEEVISNVLNHSAFIFA